MYRRPRPPLTSADVTFDVALALGLTALSLAAILGGAQDAGSREPLSVGVLLLESLPLIWRRRYPIPILLFVVAATVVHVQLAAGPTGLNEGLGSLVALFTVAERYERRVTIPAALLTGAAFAGAIALQGVLPQGLQGLITTLIVIGLTWALGDWARDRYRYTVLLEEQTRLLVAEREERERRAIQDERDRIARELHDIVTHHVSVIVIQAGAALTAMDRRPEVARDALAAIDRTGRAALADMRRMLGILGAADDAGPVREPMPGLERLGSLVEEVRAAGLAVELAVEGPRRALDAGVELSAYRIVQEALTNALKHARGSRASVHVRYEAAAVAITVTDEGGAGQRDLGLGGSGGHGLVGMRERATVFGGTFDAGPTPTGFRVSARLPVTTSPTLVTGEGT